MTAYALDLWQRACKALMVARRDLPIDPDAAASRAYYAAFYAVSAHFALEGKTFVRHTAVEAAVHRDLVRPGIWPVDLGAGYSRLAQLRLLADYGGGEHAQPAAAAQAIDIAHDILVACHRADPQVFPLQ